jgi:hypothetical protein
MDDDRPPADPAPPSSRPRATRLLVWSWPSAALGAVYGLPGAALAPAHVRPGLALAVGVLPAAIAGLAATRRARVSVLVLGVATGLSIFCGGVLAGTPVLAVAAIGLLGIATALLAARSRAGQIGMTLTLPLVGIGFSYSDVDVAAGTTALMVAGSLYAFVVLMIWPETAPAGTAPGSAAVTPTLGYGVRLGAAGATAAAIGFALELEHVGWACAAALLVMRPAAEMQRLRSVGRIGAVSAGALAAVALVHLDRRHSSTVSRRSQPSQRRPPPHRSRWYVTPAFTTFLVFLLLLYADPDTAGSRLTERIGETALGIAIAWAFGLVLPATAPSRRRAHGAAGR